MATTQPMMISNMLGMHNLSLHSPHDGSPPSLSYSPGSINAPSSAAPSSPDSLKTAHSSLSASPSSTDEHNVKKRPSFIRRKPVPRLTLEDELALLDDESRRRDDPPPPPPGFSLLPALELLAKKQAEQTARPLYSVVPDPPSIVMLSNFRPPPVATSVPRSLPTIIATAAAVTPAEQGPPSPIPLDSNSVSEIAIQWYTTPVTDAVNSKRFRLPSDAAQACGSHAAKYAARPSCRSTMVESEVDEDARVETLAVEESDYDSQEEANEKRVSIMTDTFGPANHIRECKTGRCSLTSVSLRSEQGAESEDDFEDESRDYVSAIPVPILAKNSSEHNEDEELDIFGEEVHLSEYRWLPKRFFYHKEGRKQTSQTTSTTSTEKYPRSRSPTYDQDAQSFVTAQEVPSTPSLFNESEVFRTPRNVSTSRLPRPFISTSPSTVSADSESIHSNAATATNSDGSNENDSIFDSPSRRPNLPSRDSLYSISSEPTAGIGMTYRSTLPGRKISLSASPGTPGGYSAATMRWDRSVAVANKERNNVVRRPYSADNPSYINVFPPPPADYQKKLDDMVKKRNLSAATPTVIAGNNTPSGNQNRSKAFSLVMRELLALHEVAIKARHEAARARALKKAAAKAALKLYTYQRPGVEALKEAADCVVYTATGKEVRFGDLYEGARTIVCFIRHYWCTSCQDYLSSIMRVEPAELRALNLQLIIIGCGNWKMIDGYRRALQGCQFPIYSDPTREVYQHFGIHMSSMAAGPKPAYTRNGVVVNTLVSLKRNTAMPLKNPGDLNGLGGEFVIGPGKTECVYAHRMKNTRDHAELVDILKAIGMSAPKQLEVKPEVVRRARSAEEIREDQVHKRAESIRRKRMKGYKSGRVVVTVPEYAHAKEVSVQTI